MNESESELNKHRLIKFLKDCDVSSDIIYISDDFTLWV